jgi:ubiquinone/menaquinone biosynthesis C-methylase UbiE
MNTYDPGQFKLQEKKAYSQSAETYDKYAQRAMGPYLPTLLSPLDLRPGQKVLDVGCGTGTAAFTAAPMVQPGGKVTGVDLAPGMVALANDKVKALDLEGVVFKEADAEDLPFAEASFDRVVCHVGLIHFTDRQRALEEMHRVLRPGGRLAASCWVSPQETAVIGLALGAVMEHWPQARVPGAPTWFDLGANGALEDLLDRSGFAQVSASYSSQSFAAADVEDFWQVVLGVSGRMRMLLEMVPEDVAQNIQASAQASAAEFSMDGRLEIPADAWLAWAVKP